MSLIATRVLKIVAVVHAIMLLSVATIFDSPDQSAAPLAIAFGLITGHATLAAMWTVFGTARFWVRLTTSIATWVLLSIVFGCYVIRTSGPESVVVIGTVALLIQWLIAVLPLWLMRRRGWGLATGSTVAASIKAQFHLRHVFAWVTAVAILFAISRLVVPLILQAMDKDANAFVVFFSIFVVGHALIAGPIIWTILSRRRIVAWGAAALFATVVVTYLEYLCFRETGFGQMLNAAAFPTTMSVTFVLTLCSLLIFMRIRGWSLETRETEPILL